MSTSKTNTYEFTLELAGPDVTAEETFDLLSTATDDSAPLSPVGREPVRGL